MPAIIVVYGCISATGTTGSISNAACRTAAAICSGGPGVRATIAIGNMNVCVSGRNSSGIGSLIQAAMADVADHADDLHRSHPCRCGRS